MSIPRFAFACLIFLFTSLVHADPARVDLFSPQGTAKGVRQATARFSVSMVPFGEPRLPDPFDVTCAVKGSGRWIDDRNWVYDFGRELPAGLRCTFGLRRGLADAAGQPVAAANFAFSTGGPAVIASLPHDGARTIDEEQAFLLALDAPATEKSVLEHAWCDVAGIGERIGVTLLQGAERAALLEANRAFTEDHLRRHYRPGGRAYRSSDWSAALAAAGLPIEVVQCQRRFPNDAKVRLVWGKGIGAASGVATAQDQTLSFGTRPAFRARLTCTRASKNAQCIPLLPITVSFSAPVVRSEAEKVLLRGADGTTYPATVDRDENLVQRVTFEGPFPEQAVLTVELPAEIRDDAGRTLANAASFPLTVKTDENPPLAKFAARFGIVEANAGAALPVTVRNVASTAGQGRPAIEGKVLRVDAASPAAVADWLGRLAALERSEWRYDPKTRTNVPVRRVGDRSIFGSADKPGAFQVPMTAGAKATEVIGIPLKRPGFYVVELASPRLGAALLGRPRPYYAQAAALVTNLAVHLKLGRESSLVWVTRLDRGSPVPGAEVTVADCGGHAHFSGRTDAEGLLRIPKALPARTTLPDCKSEGDKQFLVTARLGDDVGFVLSDWNEGIAPWRFNLETGAWEGPYIATTVFDRTLLRAGETVHMKHFFRRHAARGLEVVPADALEDRIVIRHGGSDDRFEVPVKWDAQGIAESAWSIPKEAKQGTYTVSVLDRFDATSAKDAPRERAAGAFRVESFRVPTMKAVLLPPKAPLVRADSATVDAQVSYLSGGSAALLPVRLRGLVEPKSVRFPDFEGFSIANGDVKQGVEAQGERYPAEEDEPESESPQPGAGQRLLPARSFTLDKAGGGRFAFDDLPTYDTPQALIAELDYPDPNGERLTATTTIPLWPSRVLAGLKLDHWMGAQDRIKFDALAVDVNGKPVAGQAIRVDLLTRSYFTHRKRLVGGFYAYDNVVDVKRIGTVCEGRTDRSGLLHCEIKPGVSGNVVLRAEVKDDAGNVAFANRDAWVAGKDEWWFDQKDGDRMDVLPERKRYEPGETARLQVRMPFREATALVTVEREGVLDGYVTRLEGRSPLVDVPVKGEHAPNIYVSVLAVRGRVTDVQPTALVDLGKPSFRLGIAEVGVGYRAHELTVRVQPDRDVYRVREKAMVTVRASRADGGKLPANAEIALAAVDEGLLSLWPNQSWNLLDAMMQKRGIEVETSTAQMEVIGKRHYGRKALLTGGGGGRMNARELFETLLVWRGRVKLDARGEARIEVPLNDSLTSFRIVAIADADAGLFGTGEAQIRTTQDVMLMSGLPPVVRDGDRIASGYTVRNATDKPLSLEVTPAVRAVDGTGGALASPRLKVQRVDLAPGEARELSWDVTVPAGAAGLVWDVTASDPRVAGARDAIRIDQKVVPAVPVATLQGTIAQIDPSFRMPVQAPQGALPGRGGVQVTLAPRIGGDLPGVREYMSAYPFTCLEQRASQAIALRDASRWQAVVETLPAHLDRDGLARYFASMGEGSEVLTAYLLTIASEAGWALSDATRDRMLDGLTAFASGRLQRSSEIGAADLVLRKLAALDALSRYRKDLSPRLLDTITLEPNLWPTSALLDWISLLTRMQGVADQEARLAEARRVLRTRMTLQGTVLVSSTERRDGLWWLMVSPDSNANRTLLVMLDDPEAQPDLGRLARGALARQQRGHWDTTPANAWGVVAFDRFSGRLESEPVAGTTSASLADETRRLDWSATRDGATLAFPWLKVAGDLTVTQAGSGKPWATVLSRAAVPLAAPVASGYRVRKTVTPVEQKSPGAWTRGDIARIRLDVEADQDMTWVVVSDPVPAGATILGTGLGGDARALSGTTKRSGSVWPAFEERTFESFRVYYRFAPQGGWSLEYLVRLNGAGRFELPPTRVEALYAPEMFAAVPNAPIEVRP